MCVRRKAVGDFPGLLKTLLVHAVPTKHLSLRSPRHSLRRIAKSKPRDREPFAAAWLATSPSKRAGHSRVQAESPRPLAPKAALASCRDASDTARQHSPPRTPTARSA